MSKDVLRGKFITLNSYIKKEENSDIGHVSSLLKNLENEEQNKPKARRREEIINTGSEINETENKGNP